jgi:two-component system response regulator YesN
MYKLLLVDDEELEMRYTRTIIEQSSLDIKIVGEVLNGEEAIERCRSDQPDIVFMDIKMPGLDGLTALRMIQTDCPEVKTIIVTAYDEFEFAREALKLGASDYLLKPVSKTEIISVLRLLLQRIQRERAQKKEQEKARQQLTLNLPYIETGFVLALILGGHTTGESVSREDLFDIKLSPAAVIVVETPSRSSFWGYEKPKPVSPDYELFATVLEKKIRHHRNCLGARIGENRFAIVIAPQEGEEKEPYHMAEQFQQSIAQEGLPLFCGVGRTVPDPGILHESFREALQALNFAFLNGGSPVQHIDALTRWKTKQANYPLDKEQALLGKLRRLDIEGFSQELASFCTEILPPPAANATLAKLWALELEISLCRSAEEIWYQGEELAQLALFGMETILAAQTPRELQERILAWGKQLAEILENKQKELEHTVVPKAVAFLEKNHHTSLSLEDIAAHVHVSPFHFSRLFKQETGTTFLEYLTQIRITHAKILLRTTDISVTAVGNKVGYQDPNYFSRVFRKNEGITPSQYRRVFTGI